MRVERDGIGAAKAGERRAATFRDHGRSAVCAVYMQPEILTGTEIGEWAKWIHRTCVRCAGVRDDTKWLEPSRAISLDRLFQIRTRKP